MKIEFPSTSFESYQAYEALRALSSSQILVWGHGPLDAKIALVAEHPGPDELQSKIPLTGNSGQLLNQMLQNAGIRRTSFEILNSSQGQPSLKTTVESEIYCTNICKFLPSGDFERTFYEGPARMRVPNAALLEATDLLRAELEQTKANVLVACGEHALRALTGRRGITNWQGSILESTLLPGRKVIPIIHPAKILREWSFKPLTQLTLKRIKEEAEFPEIRLPQRTYIIEPTFDEVCRTFERYFSAEYLSFDIETKYGHIACLGIAPSPFEAICIPFIAGAKDYWTSPEQEARVWQLIAQLMATDIKKIAQNCLFDCTHLAIHGVHVNNMWWDTMLAQNVLYPEFEKSLAVLCSMYTKIPYYKAEGRAALKLKSDKAWNPAQIDRQLWIYNTKDCVATYEVAIEQGKDFKESAHVNLLSQSE